MKAVNIIWDIDTEDMEMCADNLDLPSEIEIPDNLIDEEDISDYITELTGFCHCGFDIVEE